MLGHTLAWQAEADGGKVNLNRTLRAVKSVDRPALWVQDFYLSEREPFDHAHQPLTEGALPEPRFAGWSHSWGWVLSEEMAATRKQVVAAPVGKPTEVADAREALGQHVLKKAAQKLLACKSQGASLVVMRVIFPAEGYVGIVDGEKTMVGDGHAMSVASQIMQDVVWPAKGRLGIDDPFLTEQGAQECREGLRVSERQAFSVEHQLVSAKGAA